MAGAQLLNCHGARGRPQSGDQNWRPMSVPAGCRVCLERTGKYWLTHAEVKNCFVSKLCHIPPQTPGQHRDLRGHVDAYRCCV